MWRFTPIFFLFGCPVSPTDVQDVEEQQLPKQGNNMPPGKGGNNNGQGNMGTPQENLEGGLYKDPNASGSGQNMMQNIDDPNMAQNPGAAQEVLPIYEDPPSFSQLIENDQSVTINLSVSGSDSYNVEFVIAQEASGRLAPKVVHIDKGTSGSMQIKAPRNFPNPVWLIITADIGNDGPTQNDLFAGSKDPITIGSEDISLEYTLVNDDSWMETLPWFSRVGNPVSKQNGEPVNTEGN